MYVFVVLQLTMLQRATPNSFGSDFGVFADATAIYTTGKNSFRNQTLPPTYRVAKTVIERNYTLGNPVLAEAWYDLAANRFYTDLNRFYLDKYIRWVYSSCWSLQPYIAAAAALGHAHFLMVPAHMLPHRARNNNGNDAEYSIAVTPNSCPAACSEPLAGRGEFNKSAGRTYWQSLAHHTQCCG